MFLFPYLSFVAAVIWGISLSLGGFSVTRKQLATAFCINLMILYLVTPAGNYLYYILIAGLPGLTIGMLMTQKRDFKQLSKWAIITALTGTVIFMSMIYINMARDGQAEIQEDLTSYIQTTIEENAQLGLYDFYEKQGIPEEQLRGIINKAAQWTAYHIPAFLLIEAIFMVYFILLILSWLARKNNWEWFKKKPFSQEMMPWQLSWLIIIGLALLLWGKDYADIWYYVGSNILIVLAPISFYYGLAVAYYRYKLLPEEKTKWALMLIAIIAFMVPQGLIIFLMLMGIFDSFIDYRKLNQKKGEKT